MSAVASVLTINEDFDSCHRIFRDPSRDNREFIEVNTETSCLEVCTYGAQIFNFIPAHQSNALFSNPAAEYAEGKPVRGGDFLAGPWFGKPVALPGKEPQDLPLHGLLRTRTWQLGEIRQQNDGILIPLTLNVAAEESCGFGRFTASQEIFVAAEYPAYSVMTTLVNTGDRSIYPQLVAHTYYHVGDINRVAVSDLGNTRFTDRTTSPSTEGVSQEGDLRIAGHIDRIFNGVGRSVSLVDPVLRRLITVSQQMFINEECLKDSSVVVWNPADAKKFHDLPEDAYKRFVCIEPGNASVAVELRPGDSLKFSKTVAVSQLPKVD